jgi:hypothetical protein
MEQALWEWTRLTFPKLLRIMGCSQFQKDLPLEEPKQSLCKRMKRKMREWTLTGEKEGFECIIKHRLITICSRVTLCSSF